MAPERVALVTGGSRGIGRAIAEALLADGAEVVVCSRRAPETLPAAGGRTATHQACDVRDADAVKGLVDSVLERHGRLDIVINNAGGSPPSDAATVSPRFVEKVVALNLLAPFWVCQQAHRAMAGQGGAIVNVASVSGARPSPGTAAYGAAKAGLLNLTKTLGVEWAADGVRVNAVVAGLVATEAANDHYGGPEGVERLGRTVPLGRMATPNDIAEACVWLASDAAGYVTGACLEVHGGGEWPAFLRPKG